MRLNYRSLLVIVFLLFFVSCRESGNQLVAEQFKRGIEYYESGDYEKAYKIFMPMAEKGHRGAQNNIGIFYCEGYYVEKDFEQAFYWFYKSANSGNVNAMDNVADLFLRGKGVAESCSKAVEFYTKGYNYGNLKSAFTLGRLYRLGECVEQDLQMSAYYFSEAASSNSEYGLLSKAYMFFYGVGVAKDYKEAYKLFKILDENYKIGEVPFYLAIMYYNGFGTTKDHEKALLYYKEAYNHGSKESGYSVGYMAYHGQAEIDPMEAFSILFDNANSGHTRSQKLLSVFYKEGFGVDIDLKKAEFWEKQSKMK